MDPVQRCELALERIRADAALRAWCHLDADRALQAAAASASRLRSGEPLGPLDGLLFAVKANIAVRGWPHEGGLGSRAGIVANDDAPIITALRESGAILLGQTAMDEGALGAEGRSIEGPIGHPQDAAYSPGGSSGGSAVALAAGHCDLALGTDTIGSVRIPAALCGIAALKPSFASLPLKDVLPVHPHYDHLGPMAKDLPSLHALWHWLTGRGHPPALAPLTLRALPIGYLTGLQHLGTAPLVIERYAEALERLGAAGAELVPIAADAGGFELTRVRRAVFTLCEVELAATHAETLRTAPTRFSEKFLALLRYGASVGTDKQTELARYINDFRHHWQEATQGLAAVVMPVSPIDKFRHDEPAPAHIADLTVIATAAGLPALATPGGLQIVVPEHEEHRAFSLGAALEQAI